MKDLKRLQMNEIDYSKLRIAHGLLEILSKKSTYSLKIEFFAGQYTMFYVQRHPGEPSREFHNIDDVLKELQTLLFVNS